MSKRFSVAGVLCALLLVGGCLVNEEAAFAEFRVTHAQSGVQLLGFAKMESMDDCEQRRQRVVERMTTACEECSTRSIECRSALPDRYGKLFDNAPIQATYLALSRGRDQDERDGRLVIFGVPSSEAVKLCPRLRDMFKRSYSGDIACVQGTVG